MQKIIKNDPSDPGKAMNLTMEFSEFPYNEYDSNGWTRNAWTRIYLCNKKFDIPKNSYKKLNIYQLLRKNCDPQRLKVNFLHSRH